MGNVYRRGAKWYVSWSNAAGVVRRQVTSAKTEREAKALLAELEGQASRVRLGLEAAPIKIRATLEQLCTWWLTERCPEPSRRMEGMRLKKHVFAHELGRLPLQLVTADAIETRLEAMERGGEGVKGLKPASINRLRTTLHSVFAAAAEPPRKWQGENPVASTRVRQVARFHVVTLDLTQLAQVLPAVPEQWRGVMATAAFLGLRKGEIFALRKSDYDRAAQSLRVAGSNQRDTTKGDRIDWLPVPAILKPYLERAMKSRSVWLFPGKNDQQRTRESDPHLVLRHACTRAGIVDHWEQWCRRCKAQGRPVLHSRIDGARPSDSRCTTCGMVLWTHGAELHIRFHDLRHGLATNLLKAGVPLPHVQRILRHASITTTINTYGHLASEDLRVSLDLQSSKPVDAPKLSVVGPDPP